MVPPPFSLLSRFIFILYWIAQKIEVSCRRKILAAPDEQPDKQPLKPWLPIVRWQIVSEMTHLNLRKMLVERHNSDRLDVTSFLRVLRKYEESHAESVEINDKTQVSVQVDLGG